MNIKAINFLNCNPSFSSKKIEKDEQEKPSPSIYEPEAPQIWFSDVIGPNGREMMGSHFIGFSDVIGEDGTRARIFDMKC